MTEQEAGACLDQICSKVFPSTAAPRPASHAPPAPVSRGFFFARAGNSPVLKDVLGDMNKELKAMDLEIRGYYTGERVDDVDVKALALINLVSDDVAKVEGGRLKPEEVELFKKILASIAKSEDQAVPIDELRDGKGKLTNPQFDAFVEGLVEARWLDKKADDFDVLFGPRSFLELADVIRDHGAEVPQMINY